MTHPRDRYLTVYGRKPVLEVLEQPDLAVARVHLSRTARGPIVAAIRRSAALRGVAVHERSAAEINRISRRAAQDQGVAADVEAPRMGALEEHLASIEGAARQRVLALDNVTTPANVGMILRTATVLGWDGVIVPRRGVPEIGPLVVKASAGVAFRAPILRCAEIAGGLEAAKARGFRVYGLSGGGRTELSAFSPAPRSIFVLGNETEGLSAEVRALADEEVRIAMARFGDSLNVASAAAIVCHALR